MNPQDDPLYAAMVESLDDGVGRVRAAVEENGLMDKNIVVYFFDNGGVNWDARMRESKVGPKDLAAEFADILLTSNTPLRAGKAICYEGGVREPCIVWPGVTKAGSLSDTVIQSIRWMPTLLDMAGVVMPKQAKPDGVSLAPLLKGEKLDRDSIFHLLPLPA